MSSRWPGSRILIGSQAIYRALSGNSQKRVIPVRAKNPYFAIVREQELGNRQKSPLLTRITFVVPPGEYQLAGFASDNMEREIGIRRNCWMQFRTKHFLAAIRASKPFDDMARDGLADIVEAKAGFHRMNRKRKNFDYLSALRSWWNANF